MSNLFRQQVVDEQKQRLYGDISLAQPLSIYTVSLSILLIVTAIILFLYFSHYARKETVHGYLVPDKGVIKTHANRNGNVDILHVKEGSDVNAGDPLVTVIIRSSMISGFELSETLISELKQQQSILNQELDNNTKLNTAETLRLKKRLSDLSESMKVLSRQKQLLAEKLNIQVAQKKQHDKFYKDGYLSELDYQLQLSKLIEVKQEMENLESNKISIDRELNQTHSELASLPFQFNLKQSNVHKRQSDIQRQLNEAENSYIFVIRAQESGTVAAVSVVEGELIDSNRPLMSIIPKGSSLVAELLLPTRNAGFVKQADEARLRFDAFPYQRFGFLRSEVLRIDKALLLDGEADLPVKLSEPVYRIRTML
ncbi:HlyD family secretion protein [Shewanella sp. WE21]|jgi:membrane fusion protein|uniref:HlyD family secretion protein n=1 Tax=Shewanella sp. WE21 TaxID=2029986 RepID=UPI0020B10F20|nr:HlyD family efflux transporter periplasmic adaptor subunit [Shewanella sp. WE21]